LRLIADVWLNGNPGRVADRIAVVLAPRRVYDPFGLAVVLQDLGCVPRRESRVALLFKTHPHPDDRLAQLDSAVGSRLDALKGARLGERFYRVEP
jgi:predicted Zn-dependent protease